MLTRIYPMIILFLMAASGHSQNIITSNKSATTEQQIEQSCRLISGKLSSISLDECLDRKLVPSHNFSSRQKPLLIKEFPPLLNRRQPQAKILMLGGIHGDEYSSVSIMFKWMQTLDKYHSGLFHWKVVPLANPDGLLQKKSQRINANGVDLNRNFPNNDSEAALQYWKTHAYSDPRRYPGTSPMSEPETRWIVELIDEFKPDAIVTVHAPYGIIDFDGPPHPPSHLGPLYLKLLGTYPGSLGNYAGLQQGIPVVTVELPYAGIMPSQQEIARIWIDLVRWLKQNIHSDRTSLTENGQKQVVRE